MRQLIEFRVGYNKVSLDINDTSIKFNTNDNKIFQKLVATAKKCNGKFDGLYKDWEFQTTENVENFIERIKRFKNQ